MTVAARSHSKDEPSQALNARKRRLAPKKGRCVLRLRNVSLRNQHDHLVLNSVSASFMRGTISAILTGYRDLPWPPAQEPSPFLLACAGLTPLKGGRVSWPRPRSLAARFRGDLEPIGYVPRRCALNDELTVEQEMMLALAATGRFADHQAMLSLCRILVLTPLLNAQVALLTPFERLRTAIARALITGTPLLLVEEPTEFLSVEESEDLFGHFFELADLGYSIIIATRSPEVAAQSDQALILIDGEVVGNISQPDYHALNLAFSTALKHPQTSSPMTWVSTGDDSVVTIDDDELLDADYDEEFDEDEEPSMHPTWVPVVPSTRERQLRPIPLAVPPVSSSTPSGGVPTTVPPAPPVRPASKDGSAGAASASASVSAKAQGQSQLHEVDAADTSAEMPQIPSAHFFPPVGDAQPVATASSLSDETTVALQETATSSAADVTTEDAQAEAMPAAEHHGDAAHEVPPASASILLSDASEAAPDACAAPDVPTAHRHESRGTFAAHPESEEGEYYEEEPEGSLPVSVTHTQEHFYPSTTTLPQIPRPTTGPLSKDSTAVLNRAQQILTELPGPVLPLVNKERRSNNRHRS